jgi:DNA-binding Lrp family transcriptional regulator
LSHAGFGNAVRKAFTFSREEVQRREDEWQKTETSKRFPPSDSARISGMTEELIRSTRVIHQLERSIRVLELVRDRTQQVVNETVAVYERQGVSAETNPTVAKALTNIAAYNRVIREAKARIDDVERGNRRHA